MKNCIKTPNCNNKNTYNLDLKKNNKITKILIKEHHKSMKNLKNLLTIHLFMKDFILDLKNKN
jgi:hypothetical protein